MEALADWFAYLIRVAHVVAGITWIGTSFYFNWFDLSVRKSEGPTVKENPRGTLTEVHGGNFYYHEMFWPDADTPRMLHHGGPAQLTLATGLALLAFFYWVGAGTYLIDARVMAIDPLFAIAISAASLVVGWLLYHWLCRAVADDRIVLMVLVVATALAGMGYLQVFAPRAAFLHVGALLGTIMALNVVFVIIPGHIAMRRQVQGGERLDITLGAAAKRRSQHNNYFTLPVIFSMVGVHFAAGYGHAWAWIILPLAMVSGVAFRHYRNIQLETDKRAPTYLIVGLLLLAGSFGVSLIPVAGTGGGDSAVDVPGDQRAMTIIQARCATCHSRTPSDPNFSSPPNGFVLDTLDDATQQAGLAFQRLVVDRTMPLGNLTAMTEEERAALGAWLKAAANR
ncbi:MAG: hypothetical protein E2O93_04810 [Alphaproteobacteria bacterium]|nr:MAG: hypothetical protein E2O93_04810 [Alphaproteobacteria bacterium]